jgi:putative membrane protein
MKMLMILVLGFLLLGSPVGAFGQRMEGGVPQFTPIPEVLGFNTQDRHFLKDKGENIMLVTAASEMALKKASSRDVTEYAQMILNDHKNLYEELRQIALEKNVQRWIPTKLGKWDTEQLSRLDALSGPDFDRQYVHLVDDLLKEALTDCRLEVSDGAFTRLVLWAGKRLDALNRQLMSGRQLAAKFKQAE